MPFVKLNTTLRSASRPGGRQGGVPIDRDLDTLTIADMLIQLTGHQNVIAAEIDQIESDIKWLEKANTRYADVRIKIDGANNAAPNTRFGSPQRPSTAQQAHHKSSANGNNTTNNNKNVIYASHTGAPIVNAPPNSVAVACFTNQLKDLKALRDERKAMLKEIRQHLALYQLHAPNGVKILGKVKRTLGTTATQ